MTNIFNKVELLKNLKIYFKENAKLVFVFGHTGEDVFIVTKEDIVYTCGTNKYGMLGLGHNDRVEKLTKVNELCNKGVIDFSCGFKHIITLTNEGKIYSCGNNALGQLGNGTLDDCFIFKIIKNFCSERVVTVSCGHRFVFIIADRKWKCIYFWRSRM